MKPVVKLCEETNQLVKELLRVTTEQSHLLRELVNSPRELQKITQQLHHAVHMVKINMNLINLEYIFLFI